MLLMRRAVTRVIEAAIADDRESISLRTIAKNYGVSGSNGRADSGTPGSSSWLTRSRA
jgi:hypothetical protein